MLSNMPSYHVRKSLNSKAVLISSKTFEVRSCPVGHSKTTQILALPFGKRTKMHWRGIRIQAEF